MTGIFQLRATVVTRGWDGYRSKSQHRKSTLEMKFSRRSSRDSNPRPFNHESVAALTTDWAIPDPTVSIQMISRFYLSWRKQHQWSVSYKTNRVWYTEFDLFVTNLLLFEHQQKLLFVSRGTNTDRHTGVGAIMVGGLRGGGGGGEGAKLVYTLTTTEPAMITSVPEVPTNHTVSNSDSQ